MLHCTAARESLVATKFLNWVRARVRVKELGLESEGYGAIVMVKGLESSLRLGFRLEC